MHNGNAWDKKISIMAPLHSPSATNFPAILNFHNPCPILEVSVK